MTFSEVVNAIKSGKSVTYCGDRVSVDGLDYDWQEKVVWINFPNGSGFIAGGRELRAMKVS